MSKEIRAFNVDAIGLEVRKDDDDKCKIRGYAAVFDSLSEELGFFREKIEKGAFARTIVENDIRALWNHDANYVLGRNKNGTLKLEEDEHGLRIEIDPPDSQWGKDCVKSLERGDVNQMSFGFFVKKDEWDETDPKNPVRTLKEIELLEVSPVTFPAYPETSVTSRALRAMNSLIPSRNASDDNLKREVERLKERVRLLEKENL